MSGDRKKILIVDDNPVNLKVARNILMEQYDAFTVPSAEKMYQFLEKTLPDLILLDVLMPDVDGYEAICHLKNNLGMKMPVIFLTSKSDAESELKGLSLGAADYITKPFAPHLLLKRIEMHLLVESQKAELLYVNNNFERLLDQKVRTVLDLQNSILSTLGDIIEFRDNVGIEHNVQTELMMRLLLDEMQRRGVYREEIDAWDAGLILQSSQLHDVGKLSVRDSILLKPGKLTMEEFEEMKKHTTFGEIIIDKIQTGGHDSAFLRHAKIMAGTHHEKWDGSGYPSKLAGADIPLQGRLMAVTDVYDALMSKRPYKEPYSHDRAVEIIASEFGRHFDPYLLDVFWYVSRQMQ